MANYKSGQILKTSKIWQTCHSSKSLCSTYLLSPFDRSLCKFKMESYACHGNLNVPINSRFQMYMASSRILFCLWTHGIVWIYVMASWYAPPLQTCHVFSLGNNNICHGKFIHFCHLLQTRSLFGSSII